MAETRNRDPLDLVDDLRHQLARPILLSSDADLDEQGKAAYETFVNLGFCHLFGEEIPPDCQVELPGQTILAGGRRFSAVLEGFIGDVRGLPDRFDEDDPPEDVVACENILRQQMEAWAAFVAFDGAYSKIVDRGSEDVAALHAAMDRILDLIQTLDELLQQDEYIGLLAVTVGSSLLKDWRSSLAATYRELPPWWLDGTLEQAAADLDREILDSDPLAVLVRPPDQPLKLVFRRAAQESRLAAAEHGEKVVLEGNLGRELWVLEHPKPGLSTLQLNPPPQSKIAALLVTGDPIETVEPWDKSGEAVVRTADIAPVLDHAAEMELHFDV